jgi:hypothetical protein
MSNKTSSNKQKLLYFFLFVVNTFTLGIITLKIYIERGESQRAMRHEGKSYIGTLTRGQQNYFLEKKKWAKSIEEFEIGIKAETENYRYSIQNIDPIKTVDIKNYPGIMVQTGTAKKEELKSYLGAAYLSGPSSSEMKTITILCESNEPTTKEAGLPKLDGKALQCPDGYQSVN